MLLACIACSTQSSGQRAGIDSLLNVIAKTKADTAKIGLYEKLGEVYRFNEKKMDSSVWSYKQSIELNKAANYSLLKQCWDVAAIDYILFEMGDYLQSMKYAVEHLELSRQLNDTGQKAAAYLVFGHDYRELGEYRKSLDNYFKAYSDWISLQKGQHERQGNIYITLSISQTYLRMNKPDSALIYAKRGYDQSIADSAGPIILLAERIMGDIYFAQNNDEIALRYYRQYIPDYITYKEKNRDIGFVLNSMANIFMKKRQYDSAMLYAKKSLANAIKFHDQQNIYSASKTLSVLYLPKSSSDNVSTFPQPELFHGKADRLSISRLKKQFLASKDDSVKRAASDGVIREFINSVELDSAIFYSQKQLQFIDALKGHLQWKIWVRTGLASLYSTVGDYKMSLKYSIEELPLCEQIKDYLQTGYAYSGIAVAYAGLGDLRKSLQYYFKAKSAFQKIESGHWAIQNIAETYLKMHMPDSALYYNKIAYHIADTGHNQQYMKDFAIRVYGAICQEKGEDETALSYYRQFVHDFFSYNLNNREIGRVYFGIAQVFRKHNQVDSSDFYASKALSAAQLYNDKEYTYLASDFLYGLNDSLKNESLAFKYFKIAIAAKDSMSSVEKIKQIQILAYQEEVREKEQQANEAKAEARKRLIIIIISSIGVASSFLIWYRLRQLRLKYQTILEQKETEKVKVRYEKQLLELEAKALRAQMNPHFIFNCMNSIKSLIQQREEDKAITYLTTFSKLIRTIFQNSDKREITLYDEIETCKLYTQLESMRFGKKFNYQFNIDENIDLKSFKVPALVIQPFIENAIWHGIMPKEGEGFVNVSVKKGREVVYCIIDDDGIGREMSNQNKFKEKSPVHLSKGVHLTKSRLELENALNEKYSTFEITDKTDEAGKASGTIVTVAFADY